MLQLIASNQTLQRNRSKKYRKNVGSERRKETSRANGDNRKNPEQEITYDSSVSITEDEKGNK